MDQWSSRRIAAPVFLVDCETHLRRRTSSRKDSQDTAVAIVSEIWRSNVSSTVQVVQITASSESCFVEEVSTRREAGPRIDTDAPSF